MNISFFLINFLFNSSHFFFLIKTHLVFLWNFCLWGSFSTTATTTTLALAMASYCTTSSDISSSTRCCRDHRWLFCCWDYRGLFWFSYHIFYLPLLNSDRSLGWHLLGRIAVIGEI